LGLANEALTMNERLIDVVPPQLSAEQDVHRIRKFPVKSTTAVSNYDIFVLTAGRLARTALNTPA
jgi:hypothetical protein